MRATGPRLRDPVLLAACALLGACGGSPSPAGDEGPPPPAAAEPATVEELLRDGLAIGSTREEIAESLGPPDSVHSRVVPNRHQPEVRDTLFELFYPGLRVSIHRPGRGRDLLSAADVARDRYLRYPRPGIGDTREEVIRALGPPQEEAGDTLTYLCRACEGAEEPVRFVLEDGRVVRIRFSYYVD